MEPATTPDLTESENRMWNAVMNGHICDFGDGDPRRLRSPDAWGPARTVRGWVLTALLAHVGATKPPAIRKIQVHGVRVIGKVDLSHAQLTSVFLARCHFEDEIDLWLTRARTLVFETSVLASINAAGASISGTFVVLRSLVRGNISLNDARISRSAVFSGSRILGHGGWAITADGLEVGSDLMLDRGFLATGSVQLLGARISGNLTCSGGLFLNPGGRALAADGAVIGVSVFLNSLPDSGLGFLAIGTVQLPGAKIASQLVCHGGRFYNKRGDALAADGAEVGVGVFLSEIPGGTRRFHATGVVRLLGAQIGGQLNCAGGRFENPGGDALIADGASICGSAGLDASFHAAGEVSLRSAQIRDHLSCSGGRFENPKGVALSTDKAEIGNDLLLTKLPCGTGSFHATGEVQLLGTQIGGQLNCSGGRFENPGGTAMSLQQARADSLWLCDIHLEPPGLIDLIASEVSLLIDDHKTITSPGVFFRLDSFVYKRIAQSSPQDIKSRLRWLEMQGPTYYPQPFDQLAAVFRRSGSDQKATRVLIEKRRKRRETLPTWWRKFGDWFLDFSTLYGWQAWRPLVAGFLAFLHVFGLVVVAQAADLVSGPLDVNSSYHPFIHTLDVFLPIVDLGVESHWTIDTEGGGALAWLVVSYLWFLKLIGWGTVTLALAAVTRIVQRE